MRFASFQKKGNPAIGVRTDAGLVDLEVADGSLPRDLKSLIAGGKGALRRAWRAAGKAPESALVKGRINYLPPVPDPQKIICVGLNYRDHAAEAGLEAPSYPVLFARFPTSMVGHRRPLVAPKASRRYDYEAELVAVIGRRARNVRKRDALDHVAGYSIFNEGSIRDYQMKASQWTVGKNFDATGAFGPEMVTPEELPTGAKGLGIQCRVNGKVLQDSNTREMIFDVRTLVYEAARAMTLLPGDIIVTGTPAGVGFVRKPPVFLKAGDLCEVEIEGIGVLANRVRKER